MKLRLEDSLAYRVTRTARLLRRQFLGLGAQAGLELTPEQWFVLNKLHHDDGLSQTQLCDRLLADRPNMTRILAGMEGRGLVARRPDPTDGRRRIVHLTKAGQDLHDQFSEIAAAERLRLFSGLDPAALDAALALLDQLEERLT